MPLPTGKAERERIEAVRAELERAWVLSGRDQLDIAGQVVAATIAARPPFQG